MNIQGPEDEARPFTMTDEFFETIEQIAEEEGDL